LTYIYFKNIDHLWLRA